MATPVTNPLLGKWTYRSFVNTPTDPDPFDNILFGEGTLEFTDAPMQMIAGTIGTPGPNGWGPLTLSGSMTYGNPMTANFQGSGTVSGEPWIYAYIGYLVNQWPNGVAQVPAIVGSVIRVIPHSNGQAKAGVVASFIAVRQ
jgi:hypothetical protein